MSTALTASFPELHVYWFQESSSTRQCLRSSLKLLEYALRSEGAREMVQRKHVCQQLEGTNVHGQCRRNIAAWWWTKPQAEDLGGSPAYPRRVERYGTRAIVHVWYQAVH